MLQVTDSSNLSDLAAFLFFNRKKIFQVSSCKTCKIKVGYFFRKKNSKKPLISFGIVYDLTLILHCFSVSVQEAPHYFYEPVF